MYKILCFCLLLANQMNGQAFIFNQIFQPSARLNVEYAPASGGDLLGGNSDKFGYTRANFNLIVPIKSKLGVKVDWLNAIDKLKNWRQLRLKDIGDVARVKMYQIFWNIRPQVFQADYLPKDSLNFNPRPKESTFGLSTGITGLHLLRKFRILFYSANVSFMEDRNSIRQINPNFTAAIGVAHINRVIYYWYYGAVLSYNNGRVLPAPFFGIEANLMKKLWLNITLPLQMRLGWQMSKKTKFDFVTGLAGFSNGFGYQQANATDYTRSFYSGFQLRVSGVFNFKIGKQTKLYLEGGVLPYRRLQLGKTADNFYKPTLNPTFYGGISLFYSFKKSLLGSVIDGLISF